MRILSKEEINQLKREVRNRNPAAMIKLAEVFTRGNGVPINAPEAFQLYADAEATGDAEAQYIYGCLHYHGNLVEKDHEAAAHYFTLAAEQDHVEASCLLAVLYYAGEGVKQDFDKAFELFEFCASQGHPFAKVTLAKHYYYGYGRGKDYTKSLDWIKSATQTDDIRILEYLKDFYETIQTDISNHKTAWGDQKQAQLDALETFAQQIKPAIDNCEKALKDWQRAIQSPYPGAMDKTQP